MGERNSKESGYTQPMLEGWSTPEIIETELDNCLVLTKPIYTDTRKTQEWTCSLHAQPTLFQPDENTVYIASATGLQAKHARQKSLKPGDRVCLKGVVSTNAVAYPGGKTETLYYISLTEPPVITAREPRVSTTRYEQRQAKRRPPRSTH